MSALPDRRRINGPSTPTTAPFFATPAPATIPARAPTELRKIFLKTALTPPATGSAFFEHPPPSTLKLTASVYGPRPLPPSSAFSANAKISCELKFAPFSTAGARRGYVRDALERDLSSQLQIALASSIRASVYPKSAIDVFVTVLDCEGAIDDADGLGVMGVLAAAVNCAAAAVADAGIECVDLVAAGVAAVGQDGVVRLDPVGEARAAALVAYMAARDEVTLVWTRGEGGEEEMEALVESAVGVASRVRGVVNEAVMERLVAVLDAKKPKDVEMSG